jgi:hypothetical protein
VTPTNSATDFSVTAALGRKPAFGFRGFIPPGFSSPYRYHPCLSMRQESLANAQTLALYMSSEQKP